MKLFLNYDFLLSWTSYNILFLLWCERILKEKKKLSQQTSYSNVIFIVYSSSLKINHSIYFVYCDIVNFFGIKSYEKCIQYSLPPPSFCLTVNSNNTVKEKDQIFLLFKFILTQFPKNIKNKLNLKLKCNDYMFFRLVFILFWWF